MKKILSAIFVLMLTAALLGACSNKITDEDGLIAAARNELQTSSAQEINMEIAGSSIEDDRVLFWFMAGDDINGYRYLPIEFIREEDGSYTFYKDFSPLPRARDIVVLPEWHNGYSFLVNNADCRNIIIDIGSDNLITIPVESIPFVYHYPRLSFDYKFVDEHGQELY